MVVAAVALVSLFTTAGTQARTATPLPADALVPNTVAFFDRLHGVVGTGSRGSGTISVTSDGARTWHVALRTKRPVVAVAHFHDAYYARTDDGRTFTADEAATHWQRTTRLSFLGYCPKGWERHYSAEFVDPNIESPWSICSGPPGAGNQAKAVYRGTKRVAFTPFAAHGGNGGISIYGYPSGIAGADGGFGIVWESRGTLYVTRDGGRHWHALPKVARPELDFGVWADTSAAQGTGFVLLMRTVGSRARRRLIETTDAGRTWRVVHRWR